MDFRLTEEQVMIRAVVRDFAQKETPPVTRDNSRNEHFFMAKYFASETGSKVANQAMQIHGSYGYTDEYPVARLLREVRVSSILEGTSQVQKLIIGRSLTGINAFV